MFCLSVLKLKQNKFNFGGNNLVEESKLKKQLKDTKEQSRFTLFPTYDKAMIVEAKHRAVKAF